MQVREKVAKSRSTMFFQWFVAAEGQKLGSLKRRVRSHVARCERTNCTPLWHEARFQVKMYKAHHSRTTFGSGDVEKVHAVVVWSTFQSQKCSSEHFCTFRCRFCVAGARDYAPCQRWEKREGFVAFPKTIAGVGHLQRIWQDVFRVAGAVQETRLHSATLHYAATTTTNTFTPTLHYTTLHYIHYTQLITLHYANYSYNYNNGNLHYTTLPYITLHSTHYTTTNSIATTLITLLTLHHSYNSTNYTTTTTTAALRHATSSSCGWRDRPGDHCNHCNHSKKHNSNHLSVSGVALPSVIHNNQALL